MSSWFKKGKEGRAESEKKDAQAKARQEARGPLRFWLKNETEAKITFLDSPDFYCSEHNLQLNGKWNNHFTCLGDFDVCPPCEQGDAPSYILVGTVIDHSVYIDDEGKEFRDQKKLLVTKGQARQNLLRQIDKRGNLKFAHYTLARGKSKQECSTGETFEYEKVLTKESLVKYIKAVWDKQNKKYTDKDIEEFLTPYDYEKVFAPKTSEELRKIVGGVAPVGSSEEVEAIGGSETTEVITDDIKSIDDLL